MEVGLDRRASRWLNDADGFAAVLGFAYDFHVGLSLQQITEPLSHDSVVIGQQYADFGHDTGFPSQGIESSTTVPLRG